MPTHSLCIEKLFNGLKADHMNLVALAAGIGLAVAYAATPIVRSIALRLDIVAHPGGRRVHSRPTPMLGGVAMYVGFFAAVLSVVWLDKNLVINHQVWGLLLGGTLVAVVGVLDDKFELPGWVQALSILVAGAILAAFGTKIAYVTNPFKGGHLMWLGWVSVPATMIWMLMVTKAVDCMDGMDGLAAGISCIAAFTLMMMAVESADKPMSAMSAVLAASLMGATFGFLRFNYPPAKIFMGTVGAQFLGFLLAGISIAGAYKIATLVAVAVPILVLGVPLFDTTFVVIRRIVSGKKLHEADTSHLHHRLVGMGMSQRQTIWFIYSLTSVLCGAAYALFRFVK